MSDFKVRMHLKSGQSFNSLKDFYQLIFPKTCFSDHSKHLVFIHFKLQKQKLNKII